ALVLVGAALVVLIVASPAFVLLALAYHAGLAAVLVRDARSLPPPNAFSASREMPEPLSLGQVQEVLVGISCPATAGLGATVADHALAALSPRAQKLNDSFNDNNFLI